MPPSKIQTRPLRIQQQSSLESLQFQQKTDAFCHAIISRLSDFRLYSKKKLQCTDGWNKTLFSTGGNQLALRLEGRRAYMQWDLRISW